MLPSYLVDFIASFLQGKKLGGSLLDPFYAPGGLLLTVAEQVHATEVIGITRQAAAPELLSIVDLGFRPSLIVGELGASLGKVARIEAIVASPPIGAGRSSLSIRGVTVKGELGELGFLQACARMAGEGVGLAVLPPAFVNRRPPDGVRASLSHLGLFLSGLIDLPVGVWGPATRLGGVLAVITRQETHRLFVGELTEDRQRNEVLLRNLMHGKPGPEVALGALVSEESFESFGKLRTAERIETLSRILGIPAITLADVQKSVHVPKGAGKTPLHLQQNALILPLIGTAPVKLQTEDVAVSKEFAQIVLEPEKAIASYVASFLNTELGRECRSELLVGQTIPRIQPRRLAALRLFLPPLEEQRAIAGAAARLDQVRNQLDELAAQLWSAPKKAAETIRGIERYQTEERFEDWLDCLPFPLAAILWTYHTASEERKGKHLLNFFEALAEFHAIVLLSAFKDDEAAIDEVREALKKHSLERATFGTWLQVFSKLGKRLRGMSPGSLREMRAALLCTANSETAEMLGSNEIFNAANAANQIRNDVAHGGGGVTSEQHLELTALLSRTRKAIGVRWAEFELIKAGAGRFVDGRHHYSVQRVMGTRAPFARKDVAVKAPLEDGVLCLLDSSYGRGLQLLSLVRLKSSPTGEESACYFYSRHEKEGERFVSYQYEDAKALVETNAAGLEILAKLQTRGA